MRLRVRSAPIIPSRSLHAWPDATSGRWATCSGLPISASTSPASRQAGASALRHAHTRQDEFVYILEGRPTLVTDAGRTALEPGMCAGFKAGTGDAHHLVNETEADVVYLEIGDRSAGDAVNYPDDDLAVVTIEGQRRAAHKDGTPY